MRPQSLFGYLPITQHQKIEKNIISWNLPFFLLAKFRQKENFKHLKFEDELILDNFYCSKQKKMKNENCHVSIFGFRRVMIKDLHRTFTKSSYG
jgi:hypothetical protein